MEEMKIDQVISNLSKIEASAAKVINDAEEEKASYTKYIESEIKKFDAEFEEKTSKQLEELTNNLEETQKKELTDMRAEIVAYVNKMEEDFNDNHEKYAKAIFERIIKE